MPGTTSAKNHYQEVKKISVIIPCYENEDNMPDLFRELQALVYANNNLTFEFVFVDDGSRDNTYEVIREHGEKIEQCEVLVVRLLKNCGSYNALLAGMHYATGDANVHLHADLQDPPDLIPELVDEWQKGVRLVIAHRVSRDDGMLQDFMSNTFHAFIRRFILPHAPAGGFDLMLFDNVIKDRILGMKEHNIHLVYLFIWLDYPYTKIPYTRKRRKVGKSSYSMRKRIKLAVDTIVGFSSFPIRMIWMTGSLLMLAAVACGIVFALSASLSRVDVYFLALVMISGLLLISIGIVGEYLWRTLEITRNRPNFMVDNIYYCHRKEAEDA